MDPGRSGKVRFQLRYADALPGDLVSVTATPYFNGVQSGAPVTTTRSLIV